jgi:hypothetical protein
MYYVKVPCTNVVKQYEMREWTKSVGMKIITYEWIVINDEQYIKFFFKNEQDVTMFLLRWS